MPLIVRSGTYLGSIWIKRRAIRLTCARPNRNDAATFVNSVVDIQQPRQMLFTLRSMVLFSSVIAASVSLRVFGPLAAVPPIPPAAPPPAPVVTPDRELEAAPDDCAVPELLVPDADGVASLAALPAPLGSLTELLRPPALPGPDATPLVPDDPAPAVPALGLPTALGLPAEAPLAAPPPAAAPLAPPPPAPPEPPPPPCARATEALARNTKATQVESDNLVIG